MIENMFDDTSWEALCAGDPLAEVWSEFPVDEPPAEKADFSTESRGAAATERVRAQLLADEALDAADLVEVMAHCRATIATANYRLLQAASALHDIRAEEYGLRIAAATGTPTDAVDGPAGETAGDSGQRTPTQMGKAIVDGLGGRDPLAEYGLDGLQQAITEVGATLSMHPTVARALILSGYATRYRLPVTATRTLAIGRIDLQRFQIAQYRTELVDPEKLAIVDERLAAAILRRDHMSTRRFTDLVDAIVAKVDAEAIKQRRQRAAADRKVSVRPDRRNPGQSQMNASLPLADGALVDARLTDMASHVHSEDPRTFTQRRADALITLSEGGTRLICHCNACTTPPSTDHTDTDPQATQNTDAENTEDIDADVPTSYPVAEPRPATEDVPITGDASAPTDSASASADTDESSSPTTESGPTAPDPSPGAACTCTCDHHTPPPQPEPEPAPHPRAIIHLVANQSTLAGEDEDPTYLDGFGILDADSARDLAAHATTRIIGVDPTRIIDTLATMRYRPGKHVQAFVRTGELCCTFPGCNNPVWLADLDHTHPFDHTDPTRGGPTHHHNLKPLCRLHHRAKTFTAWRDYQDPLGTVTFTSPTGHTFIGNAFRGTDLFPALTPQPPDHQSRTEADTITNTKRATNKRATNRHNTNNPPPF